MKYSATHKLTYEGEAKSLSEWAKEKGITTRALQQRLERATRKTELTEETLGEVLNKEVEDKSLGVRTRTILRLMESFERHSADRLDEEVKNYIIEKGALAFYREFNTFFPKIPNLTLDGAEKEQTGQKPANIVIAFNGAPPNGSTINLLEDNDL